VAQALLGHGGCGGSMRQAARHAAGTVAGLLLRSPTDVLAWMILVGLAIGVWMALLLYFTITSTRTSGDEKPQLGNASRLPQVRAGERLHVGHLTPGGPRRQSREVPCC